MKRVVTHWSIMETNSVMFYKVILDDDCINMIMPIYHNLNRLGRHE